MIPGHSIFGNLQELSNYPVARNLTFDPFHVLMWVYDSHIEQRYKGLSVTFNSAAREGLARIFQKLRIALKNLPVKGIPSMIESRLTDSTHYNVIRGDIGKLLEFVADVTKAVERIEYNIEVVRIEPEIADMLWNPSKPRWWPYTRHDDFDDDFNEFEDKSSDIVALTIVSRSIDGET
ncbi:hypothetical protein TWF694_008122 [Orbilia ellipsospora]|uniref:Uncharacterized protein n=1 Tax=Orbilia ellipsospora TaxID=2528407 RepID=A0AAV9XF47_9PEZI